MEKAKGVGVDLIRVSLIMPLSSNSTIIVSGCKSLFDSARKKYRNAQQHIDHYHRFLQIFTSKSIGILRLNLEQKKRSNIF